MRTLIILTITLITFGCSNKGKSKTSNNDSLQKTPIETVKTKIDALNENVKYFGFINKFYFSNENEVYVELYFNKDDINENEYKKIESLADSLIYQDDENSRHRFPASLSQNYFDLRGLSKLKIYDNNNKFVSNADFVRVEYLNQNISPVFIAVYKADNKLKTDNLYGLSNFKAEFEPTNYSITRDTILTQKLLTKLNEKKPYDGLKNNGTHLHFNNSDKVLSIINSENFAYVVLTTSVDFKVLYKSFEYENITDIKVIPIMKNNFPYILTRNVKPETDVMWDNLLYYDGTKYINSNRQRIE
jgi:hypothetical protein